MGQVVKFFVLLFRLAVSVKNQISYFALVTIIAGRVPPDVAHVHVVTHTTAFVEAAHVQSRGAGGTAAATRRLLKCYFLDQDRLWGGDEGRLLLVVNLLNYGDLSSWKCVVFASN